MLTGQNLPPPQWNNDFIIANDVYIETVNLSGCDPMNGFPLLDKLEFVMDFRDYEVIDKSRFFDYLAAIHRYHKQMRAKK